MDAPSRIIPLHSGDSNKQKHRLLTQSLSVLDWPLQVEQIALSAGVRVGERLLVPSTPTGNYSLARKLGHTTLGEFLTGSIASGALGFDWDRWVLISKAQQYKALFNIYVDDPDQILKSYNDVVKILGHAPSDSEEFHEAKDRYILQQTEASAQKHSSEILGLRSKIEELDRTTEAAEAQIERLQKELSEANDTIQQERIQHELALVELKSNLANEQLDELKSQRLRIEAEYDERMADLRRSSDERVGAAWKEVETVKSQYSEENFVPKSELSHVKSLLDAEKTQSNELISKLSQAERSLESANMEIDRLVSQVHEQSIKISLLHKRLGYESEISDADADSVVRADERIAELEQYLVRYRESANKLKEKNYQKEVEIKRIQSKLNIARSRINMMKGKIQKKVPLTAEQKLNIIYNSLLVLSGVFGVTALVGTGVFLMGG